MSMSISVILYPFRIATVISGTQVLASTVWYPIGPCALPWIVIRYYHLRYRHRIVSHPTDPSSQTSDKGQWNHPRLDSNPSPQHKRWVTCICATKPQYLPSLTFCYLCLWILLFQWKTSLEVKIVIVKLGEFKPIFCLAVSLIYTIVINC